MHMLLCPQYLTETIDFTMTVMQYRSLKICCSTLCILVSVHMLAMEPSN